MKIAVVGATGLVGGVMLQVLEERGFGNEEVLVAASPKSVGKKIMFAGRELTVQAVEDVIAQKPRFAIFSAGASTSKQYALPFTAAGTTVIDNSSAWRMVSVVPLVVPEINIGAAIQAIKQSRNHATIIANPNCSTIQMVLALSGLQKRYGIRRIVVSTYQSVTGTGMKAIRQLEAEERGETPEAMAYPCPVHRNLFPHGGDFCDDLYTTEEHKLVDETRKIFDDKTIQVSATVARVPVVGGHSESVNVELKEEFELDEVRKIIAETEGCVLYDNPEKLEYPTPLLSHHRDEVFVGRLRRDPSQPRTLNMWVVADNLRKGAATNAIEIMQKLLAIS
ncbi:MAG: aspartate-semialdehyde dehydrogenase [Bacteroidales bacterium]|jgi:aspartate-semialdehyde dehydrogenase|nr:aspartate-semialdehyde dehydrogenase [Bacteroidales bacterium]